MFAILGQVQVVLALRELNDIPKMGDTVQRALNHLTGTIQPVIDHSCRQGEPLVVGPPLQQGMVGGGPTLWIISAGGMDGLGGCRE